MANKKKVKVNSTLFLQIGIGIFFFVLGLFGLLPSIQESIFSLSDENLALEVIFGIIEMACGIILILGLFLYGKKSLLSKVSFIIFIFWAARIFVSRFVFGIRVVNGTLYLAGGFPQWFLTLLIELILLVVLFDIKEMYRTTKS